MIPGPVSERSGPRVDVGKFGNEGIVGIDGLGQVAHQVLEEFLAGALGRSFDNAAERGNVVAGQRLWRTAPFRACSPRHGRSMRVRLRRLKHAGHRAPPEQRSRMELLSIGRREANSGGLGLPRPWVLVRLFCRLFGLGNSSAVAVIAAFSRILDSL
jgi:hypothetical protein